MGMPQYVSFLKRPTVHYGNILEYLSLWSEVQFLNIQKSKKSKTQLIWTSLQGLARKLKRC